MALRLGSIIKAMELRAALLVHATARADASCFALHQRVLAARLLGGVLIFAALPVYLLSGPALGSPGAVVLGGLSASLLAACCLSWTGSLAVSQLLASLGFVTAASALALASGGAASPMLMLLVLAPLEAQISRSTAAVIGAALLSAVALAGIWALHWLSFPQLVLEPLALVTSGTVALALLVTLATTLFSMSQRARVHEDRTHLMARSRLMLESVGDMVAWLDPSGRLSYVNEAARKVLRAQPEALSGHGLLEHVLVADRPLFLKAISDAAHSDRPVVVHIRALTGAGEGETPVPRETRWLEVHARRVMPHDSNKADRAVVAVLRDETDRRATEAEREKAREEAQLASELKGRFLATVSHELRTPLNAIIGFSEMLATDGLVTDKRQQQDYAQIIHTSGQHLLEVVNALLDISKIESGSMTIDHDALDMSRLVGECYDLMAMRCAEKGVTLEKVVAPDLPLVMADKRALKQVAINLLSNALKFTPAGGTITLAIVRDKNEIDFSVSDTGIGIAAGDLPNIGLPFYQVKSSYDRSHEGTGLGLSVVRGLVGLHGGSLTIESAPNEGTRVCVRLPIEPGAQVSGDTDRIITFAKPPRRQLGLVEPARLSA